MSDEVYTEYYNQLILSPGAAPIVPNIEGAGSERVFTLRNIPDTYRIKDFIAQKNPKSVVVVGGGYIGIEMAENLASAGLHVTVVEMADHVIAPLDFDMACDVHRHLRENGVELLLQQAVSGIKADHDKLCIQVNDSEISADMLIMAVGVRPEGNLAKDAGLHVNERGAIVVNDFMQTSDTHIYAVGDAIEIKDFVLEKGLCFLLRGRQISKGALLQIIFAEFVPGIKVLKVLLF